MGDHKHKAQNISTYLSYSVRISLHIIMYGLFLNTNYSLIGVNSLQLVKEAGRGHELVRLTKHNVIASITVRVTVRITALRLFIRGVLGGGGGGRGRGEGKSL